MQMMHRRAEIIHNLAKMLIDNLYKPDSPQFNNPTSPDVKDMPNSCDLPTRLAAVQKRYVHWTALEQQNALPAILLTYGDGGSTADSEIIGFVDETFPITVIAVMKEDDDSKDLIDQASDMHYSLATLINTNPTFDVAGVLPDKTRIANWGGSEGAVSKFEIIKFRVVVVHRYHKNECV